MRDRRITKAIVRDGGPWPTASLKRAMACRSRMRVVRSSGEAVVAALTAVSRGNLDRGSPL